MRCPFPGMDPYLEIPPFWGDFSPRFLTAISNALLEQLLPKYDVRIDEYVLVTQEEVRLHRVQPDVTISTLDRAEDVGGTAVAVAEATTVELEYPAIEPHHQRRLVVTHRLTGDVVTVMELLSPANKSAGKDGLDTYLEKRAELLTSQCHLLEIDLLRGGRRLPMVGELPLADYYIYVGRVERRPHCQAITWSLRSQLPTSISVPLLPEDPDATLNLAQVFRKTYEDSRYDQRLPYGERLMPPLEKADEQWARQCLDAAGIRRATEH